jgi:transposase
MDARTTLTLHCTACGMLTEAKCLCGAPYEHMSPTKQAERRREAAARLYNEGLTQQEIANKLGVSRPTISGDLQGLSIADKPPRPKGGRPKGTKAKRPGRDKVQAEVDALLRQGKPINRQEIGKRYGVGQHVVQLAAANAEGKLQAASDPEITPDMLSMSAQERLASAIRQHKRTLDAEYEKRRTEEIMAHIDRIAPTLQQEKNEASETKRLYMEFMKTQTKIMTRAEFMLIDSCLHVDSRKSASDEKLNRAFSTLHLKKFALTGEK